MSEMAKINQEEYQTLKGLDDKWKWIAMDESEELFVFEEKPYVEGSVWYWQEFTKIEKANKDSFQFIQWEDEEPYEIAELIEEYETASITTPKTYIDGVEQKIHDESEETEVNPQKLIENKIKELTTLTEKLDKHFWERTNDISKSTSSSEKERLTHSMEARLNHNNETKAQIDILRRILSEINQLDEPEILSREWIDEHTWNNHYVGKSFVYVDDLQNLLVPTVSEVEKVEEPETVASVIVDFAKSAQRLKEVLNIEVEELEE